MTPKARAQEALTALGKLENAMPEHYKPSEMDDWVMLIRSVILAAVEKMEKKI